jgi:hypothetical protein
VKPLAIGNFSKGSSPHSILIVELLDRQRVEELAEWNAWADEPVSIELHMRPFAGIWIKLPLPVEIAADEPLVIEYAKAMTAKREELRVVVALNRRRSVTIAQGEVAATTEAKPNVGLQPFVIIGGRRMLFEAKERLYSRGFNAKTQESAS